MGPIVCIVVVMLFAEQLGGTAKLRCKPEDTVEEKVGFSVLESRHLKSASGILYPNSFWHKVDGKHRRCVCSRSTPCFSKCCPHGQAISNRTCIKVPKDKTYLIDVRPDVHYKYDKINSSLNFDTHFNTIVGDPCEGGKKYILDPAAEQFYLQADGILWIPKPSNESLSAKKHCFETLLERKGIFPFLCSAHFGKDDDVSDNSQHTIYPIGVIISVPFLLATFLVYALVPKLLTLHGRSLMCYVASTFTGHLLIAFEPLFISGAWNKLCTASAFIVYFSYLASGFWLNVICLDIWWTFGGVRPMRDRLKKREHKKFIIYSLYCWSCPLIIVIITMVMDLHPDIPNTYLKPGFGKRRCWFYYDRAYLAYFTGPTATLILSDILLFVLTAFQIKKYKSETKILKRQESQRHDDGSSNTQRFNLYLKLFLVMGADWTVNFIVEAIYWAFGPLLFILYLNEIANALQGILIFILFVWKDRVLCLLEKTFCPKRVARRNASTIHTNTTRFGSSRIASMSVRSQNDSYRMKSLVASSPSVSSNDRHVVLVNLN